MMEFLNHFWRFLFRSDISDGIDTLASRLRLYQRLGLLGIVLFFTIAVLTQGRVFLPIVWAYETIETIVRGNDLRVDNKSKAVAATEMAAARQFLAATARDWIRENHPADDGFVWGISQMIAAAPTESKAFFEEYKNYVARMVDSGCGCFRYDGIPHTITTGWVILAYVGMKNDPPQVVVEGLLNGQNASGWWSAALDATETAENASVPATVYSVVAISELLSLKSSPPLQRDKLIAARNTAIQWLIINQPDNFLSWADYPRSSRSTAHISLSGMVALAFSKNGREPILDLEDVTLPQGIFEQSLTFASDTFVQRRSGPVYVDRYRHVPSAWAPIALAIIYPKLTVQQKIDARKQIENYLSLPLRSANLKRLEWIVAETVVARRYLLEMLDKKN